MSRRAAAPGLTAAAQQDAALTYRSTLAALVLPSTAAKVPRGPRRGATPGGCLANAELVQQQLPSGAFQQLLERRKILTSGWCSSLHCHADTCTHLLPHKQAAAAAAAEEDAHKQATALQQRLALLSGKLNEVEEERRAELAPSIRAARDDVALLRRCGRCLGW